MAYTYSAYNPFFLELFITFSLKFSFSQIVYMGYKGIERLCDTAFVFSCELFVEKSLYSQISFSKRYYLSRGSIQTFYSPYICKIFDHFMHILRGSLFLKIFKTFKCLKCFWYSLSKHFERFSNDFEHHCMSLWHC